MNGVMTILRRLTRSTEGAMIIETALVAPIMVVMCLGGFEVSQIVARNTELRTAVSEATAIAISSPPDSKSDLETIEDIIEASTGLEDKRVKLEERFRCDNNADLEDDEDDCDPAAVVSRFLVIEIEDTYTPTWTKFGIGSKIELSVDRTVQVS